MSKNYLRTRRFTTTEGLIELIHDYFEEEDFIMIETLYKHLGIYKHNYRDWATRDNKKHNLWAKIIDEAKKEIHAHLTRVTAYGQTEEELEATKVVKSDDGEKTTWEFNRADPKVIKAYMNSRFKDNWEDDDHKETNNNITINFANEGNNKVG